MPPQKNRISKDEFPDSQVRGFRVFSPSFTAVFYKNNEQIKVAVVVSKKMAKTAIVRNRIRRRVYNALPSPLQGIKGATVVFFPKKEVHDISFIVLKTEIIDAFHKAGILS